MSFETELVTKAVGHDAKGRALSELVHGLVVVIQLDGGKIQITVPKGFVTNFASTPRLLWPILPPAGRYLKAAVVHDFLYSTACSRFLADAIFRDLMQRSGVPMWKRVVMFYAVRFGGGFARKKGKVLV